MRHLKAGVLTLILALGGTAYAHASANTGGQLEYAFGPPGSQTAVQVETLNGQLLDGQEMQQTEAEFLPFLLPGLVGGAIDAAIYAATTDNFSWSGLAKAGVAGAVSAYIPGVAAVKAGVYAYKAGKRAGFGSTYRNDIAVGKDTWEGAGRDFVEEQWGIKVPTIDDFTFTGHVQAEVDDWTGGIVEDFSEFTVDSINRLHESKSSKKPKDKSKENPRTNNGLSPYGPYSPSYGGYSAPMTLANGHTEGGRVVGSVSSPRTRVTIIPLGHSSGSIGSGSKRLRLKTSDE